MIGKKINQLATELAPVSTDLTIIGDPISGVSKKITLAQLGAIFSGAVSFYTNLAGFPATGDINVIYCAKDTQKLYLWSGSAYTEVFPSQALLDTYQLRSEKGVSNGYASLDSTGKVPISQLPSSIMEYKGTWSASTNTPTLANGTGDTGDVYICNSPGSVNFGAGAITFAVGDYVIYSGSIWQRSSGAVGTVTSVAASITGNAIGITGSPVTTSGTLAFAFAGTGAQYIKGDGTLATFPSIISQAQNLITEVYNNTGATLTKGTIVYINGGQGNLPTVAKALAMGDSTSAQTFGVVQADITNMNNGYVVVAGRISDLDTQAYSNGTQLYLSPTTAGTWTSTKPYAPQHLVYVGIVVRAHPTQGVVEVKIQNGYEMDELHNVSAQSPDNNDILQYKTSTSLWTKVAGTTSNIAEGSNLYYTDARSRAALSFTAGSGAYNSTTGVITIPTNTNQLTNGAAYITLASLSAGAGISYNNTTGVIASTITQYTDAMARASISLTTTGTSGAATYNSTTGVFNIPNYAPDLSGYVPTSRTITINGTSFDLSANRSYSVGTVTSVGLSSATSGVTIGSTPVTTSGTITLAIATASGSQQGLLSSTDWTTFNNKQNALTNPVTGTGTTNYLPKFTGTSTIGNSTIIDNGTSVNIGSGYKQLTISYPSTFATKLGIGDSNFYIQTDASPETFTFFNTTGTGDFIFKNGVSATTRLTLNGSGNLGLGVTPSAWWSGARSMQIGLGGSIAARTSSDFAAVELSANQIINASAQRVYIGTGFASLYEQFDGAHKWLTAPSGTAGNAISFTQAMTLDASGRLGIGNTNMSSFDANANQLVVGTGTTNQGITIYASTSTESSLYFADGTGASSYRGYIFYSHAQDLMAIGTNGSRAITILNSNNVGIGTTSPTQTLQVNGTTLLAGPSSTPVTLQVSSSNGNCDITIQSANSSGPSRIRNYVDDLQFHTNGSERMRITSGGNVGIGTTSPGGILEARAGSGANFRVRNNGTNVLLIQNYNDTDNYRDFQIAASTLQFLTGTDGGTSAFERMRITSGGNVEIATGSIKTGEPDTGWGRAAIKIGASVSGAASNVTRYLPVSVDGTVYYINLNSSTP